MASVWFGPVGLPAWRKPEGRCAAKGLNLGGGSGGILGAGSGDLEEDLLMSRKLWTGAGMPLASLRRSTDGDRWRPTGSGIWSMKVADLPKEGWTTG